MMFSPRHVSLVFVASWVLLPQVADADWASWWHTPEQQARIAYEKGDVEALTELAPDDSWKGVAEHESGEFNAAIEAFSQASEQQRLAGNDKSANQALYNKGVSEVRAGQYEQAVESFDRVLEHDSEFHDAQHNRAIAEQLIQQQQQQEQQQQNADDQEQASDEGDQQDSSGSQGQPSDQQEGEPGATDKQDDSEQSGESEQSGDEREPSESESESQRRQDEQDARDALEAEAESGEPEDNADDENDGEPGAAPAEQPLSESEQATEQWLRRIPDDPAGLLRRKLEQSHRTEYPEVRDALEPW